eukprot:335249_1
MWQATTIIYLITVLKCQDFDYIVVGSGAGGIVAARLAENQNKVLLIESGVDDKTYSCEACGNIIPSGDFLPGTPLVMSSNRFQLTQEHMHWHSETPNAFWNYNQTVLNRSIALRRARILGGCSSHNGMVWNRGSQRDYDYVSRELGLSGWAFKDVLPYFEKIENYFGENKTMRGRDGPVKMVQAEFLPHTVKLQEIYNTLLMNGFTLNNHVNGGYSQNGVSLLDKNVANYDIDGEQRGVWNTLFFRGSTAEIYVRKIGIASGYLTVWTNTTVHRALFDDKKHKAIGVEYWRQDNTLSHVYCDKEVIVSAGVYQSAALLMLSGIGPVAQLDKFNITPVLINEYVGRFGQEHVYLDMVYQVNSTLTNLSYTLT